MPLPPRQPQSHSGCGPRRVQPIAVPAATATPRTGVRARVSTRVGALAIAFGTLAIAFAACTLTSAEFEPPLVERDVLTPDASAGPAGGCATAFDCSFGEVCTAGSCVPLAPPSEPGVVADAGVAPPCVGSDCSGEVPLPLAPTCDDGIQNGDETGVDCGGGGCSACLAGEGCSLPSDCQSGVCGDAGTCPAPRCDDGVVNQDETDVDCGGGCEQRCPAGNSCRVDGDCAADLFCPPGSAQCTPVSCGDGVRNGTEVLVDCGGGCEGCPDGSACSVAGDCASGVCSDSTCAVPACDDGASNQDETDVDCGGGCAPCDDGGSCAVGGDCTSGVCRAGTCAVPACNDGVVNQNETDVDCGGNCNRNCPVGDGCRTGADCQTGVCDGAGCGPGRECCQAPACDDGVRNGNELGVDCGGGCGPCPVGTPCTADAQCQLAFCSQGQCRDPGSCTDGAQNGRETGVDCGGADCLECDLGTCNLAADCVNGNCDAQGICISCADGVLDGSETGVDCGGADATCPRCNTGSRCNSNDDCIAPLLCLAGVCG